ncbi:polyketide synthase [Streptomyces sp. M19]
MTEPIAVISLSCRFPGPETRGVLGQPPCGDREHRPVPRPGTGAPAPVRRRGGHAGRPRPVRRGVLRILGARSRDHGPAAPAVPGDRLDGVRHRGLRPGGAPVPGRRLPRLRPQLVPGAQRPAPRRTAARPRRLPAAHPQRQGRRGDHGVLQLGLTGASMCVGSACSSSLVAVHLAVRALQSFECDMAVAGGVSLQVPQAQGHVYAEDAIYSTDGRCAAFDASASGTVGGSGVGLVLLKRLSDARRDGDLVHAVLLGSAVNNDGGHSGLHRPGVDGQRDVIVEAQAAAGIDAGGVGYVEAHGTGTGIGDPIEVEALTAAFRTTTDRVGFCALGSVKTNIGHLDAAAGIAGLIKAVGVVRDGVIPATLHYRRPNPAIDFAASPFYVNGSTTPWPEGRPAPGRGQLLRYRRHQRPRGTGTAA